MNRACPDLAATGFGATCPSTDCDTGTAATAIDGVAQVSQCAVCCAKVAANSAVAEAFTFPGGFCGDGKVGSAEQCDDGGESASCDADCSPAECGDGILNITAGEECADGNTVDGDGCTSGCMLDLGAQNPQCPAVEEFVVAADVGPSCIGNTDCAVGTCDTALGRCRSTSNLTRGSSGFGHFDEVSGGFVIKSRLFCTATGTPCGTCAVVGVDPEPRNCRCAGDNRSICNESLVADMDDWAAGIELRHFSL